jgi:hypothetical protein
LLLGFAKGQGLNEHTSTAQALIHVLLESCALRLDGLPQEAEPTKNFSTLPKSLKPIETVVGLSRVKAADRTTN